MEVDNSKEAIKKVKLKFNKSKLEIPLANAVNDYERSPSPPPSPDHFLEIVPKPTLLGKEQAKKRLQAFGQNKTPFTFSPVKKNVKCAKVLECMEEKYDEDGKKTEEISIIKKPPKRSVNHDAKYKNIIHEIEMIKKKESTIMKDAIYKTKHHRSYNLKSVSERSSKKRDESHYPSSWKEIKQRNLTLDDVKQIGLRKKILPSDKSIDAIKILKFKSPNYLLTPIKCRFSNGKDDHIPGSFVRYTSASPRISYSINSTRNKQNYFTRADVFKSISREQLDALKAFIQESKKPSVKLPKSPVKDRKWFLGGELQNVDSGCQILETSIGLAFLQNYADDDETEVNSINQEVGIKENSQVKEATENIEEDKKTMKKKEKEKKERLKVKKKRKKHDKKKSRKNKGKKKGKNVVKETGSDLNDEKKFTHKSSKKDNENKNGDNKDDATKIAVKDEFLEEIVSSESNEEFKLTKSPIRLNDIAVEDKINTNSCSNSKNEDNHDSTNKVQCDKITNKNVNDSGKIKFPKASNVKVGEDKKCNTPDTDEYHSHWESDEELVTLKENNKTDWESDEEKIKTPIIIELKQITPKTSERSLEMPLNITITPKRNNAIPIHKPKIVLNDLPKYLFTRDPWESSEVLKFKDLELRKLEEERRTLSEERKLLELEKQRIAELEKRISQKEPQLFNMLKEEDIKKEENSDLPKKRKSRKCRWEEIPEENLLIKEEKIDSSDKNVLENQYEQFLKAVTEETIENRKRKLSTSSSSEITSRSSSASSKHDNTDKIDNILLPPLPVLPVPSPSITNDLKINVYGKTNPTLCETSPRCNVDSTSSPPKTNPEFKDELDLKNRKPISSIILPKKNNVLNTHIFGNSDDEEEPEERPPSIDLPIVNPEPPKNNFNDKSREYKRSPNRYSPKKTKFRDFSPRRRSPHRYRYSPARNSSPRFRNYSPRREVSPKRLHSPRRDYSPRRNLPRNLSPRRDYSPRRNSPRRLKRRDVSPWRDRSPRRNRSASPKYRSPPRRKETIQETLTRLAGISSIDTPNPKKSPVNSPVDGFRKSLADSTISDEQLLQNREQFLESPIFYQRIETLSPKRMPLDERINQVLGINKEEPKPISTTYSQNYPCNPNYYEQYDQFNEARYNKNYLQANSAKPLPPTKVLQVGNMLQVVPIEDIPVESVEKPKQEATQKIVQVGNMLQIVPTQTLPSTLNTAELVKEKQSAEELMKAKVASRLAEREKRIQARISRKIEKEKKHAEREKRKALKIKQKTEEMIKKALMMEFDDQDDPIDEVIPTIVMNNDLRASKGILISKRSIDEKGRKGVKFADGVLPGEGTSTSGAEELSSPPPMQFLSQKDKRYTKTKKRNKHSKKKLKTKAKKKPKLMDDIDYESLPPPSPPPGSPPPNLFPPRIKHTNPQFIPVNLLQSSNLCKTSNDSSQFPSGHYTLPANRPQNNQPPQSFLMHQVQNVNISLPSINHPPPNLIQHNADVMQSPQSLSIFNPNTLPPPLQHSHIPMHSSPQQRLPFSYQRPPGHPNQGLPLQSNSFISNNQSRIQGTSPLHKTIQRMIPGINSIDSPGQNSSRQLQAGQLYPSGISPPQKGMQRQGNN